MDRRQDGTAAAAFFAAGPAPVQGGSAAPHPGHAVEGRATRREAGDRPPPVSFLPGRTAGGAATRDTGSARRPRRTTEPAPPRPAGGPRRRGRVLNAFTEILTR